MTTTEKIIAAIILLMCAVMLARADVPLTDPILPPVERPANCGGVE